MSAVLPDRADYAGALHPLRPDAEAPGHATEVRRVDAALKSARRAAPLWRRTPQAERSTSLREIAAAIESAAHELADLNSQETGRLFEDSLAGVHAGAEALRRFAELGLLRSGPSLAGAFSGLDFTVFEPRGVVLGLTSWDDPVAVACAIVGAGLAAGNTVVLKPSERCPALGRRLGWLFSSAVPAGVIGTVIGGSAVGAALAEDSRVDAVVHVGGSDVADALASLTCASGAHLVRGRPGNGVLIVDREVDAGWAASCAAEAAFRHAGQLRSAVGRVYAVVEAIRRGAVPLAGARVPDGEGLYYPPTILTGPAVTLEPLVAEVRGPVAAVARVQSFGEAIAEAAQSPCGASATVLTRDLGHAQIAAAELPVATVVVNGVVQGATGTDAPGLPQTGSPVGFGPRLLDELSRPKVIHLEPPVAARSGHGLVM
jgi:acyl-CoA reductase-like NAD-dependent aldehyde dehydrogenase